MTLAEIKAAHAQGRTVHWMNDDYIVAGKDPDNLEIQFWNNLEIKLTHADGITLNGKEEEFYTAPTREERLEILLRGARNAMRLALPYVPADTTAHNLGEWIDEINEELEKH